MAVSGSLFCLAPGARAHSAGITVSEDPTPPTFFTGTSNPPGPVLVNISAAGPGYLNGVSGGSFGSSDGNFDVGPQQLTGVVQLAALAIHLTDSAGASHSLSSLNDPALMDIVSDLNTSSGSGEATLALYAYNSAPQQFAGSQALLSAGETANGGQPFDILVVVTPIFPTESDPGWWSVGFSDEIGSLDGITSLSVTDIGVVNAPEPATVTLVLLVLIGVSLRRGRR
jgi:hypothetical protein